MITPRLRWQIGAAIVGTLGFILAYSQPWREPERLGTILLYDLAAAPLVFAFIGAYLYDLYTGERRASWRLRWALLIPTGGIPSLRALGWLAVSGHLSTTLIVGFYPAANAWRHPFLRAVALLPALVCYLIRVLWGHLECAADRKHGGTGGLDVAPEDCLTRVDNGDILQGSRAAAWLQPSRRLRGH